MTTAVQFQVHVPLRHDCECASSIHCEAPPYSCEGNPALRTECYRCGLPVCKACSSIRRTRRVGGHGKARLCDNCLEYEPDGEAKVLLRRYHEAGYPKVTLAMTKAEVAGKRTALEKLRMDERMKK
jgi:hypothetical protein